MRTAIILLFAIVTTGWLSPVANAADDDPFAWKWYELNDEGELQVNLFVFHRNSCPHCRQAIAFIDKLKERHPWLKAAKYEISHRGNLELYRRMSTSLDRTAGQVPALFYCKQMTMGYVSDQSSGRRLEAGLVYCHDQLQKQLDQQRAGEGASLSKPSTENTDALFPYGMTLLAMVQLPSEQKSEQPPPTNETPDLQIPDLEHINLDKIDLEQLDLAPPPAVAEEETFEVPFFGEVRAADMSLPALTLVIAGCDAFNPCAFFILLSLLSLLIHARNRGRMLLVGGIFVFFSGLFYFLFMAAWLNVFLLAGHLPAITITAGVLAMIVAAINIKDYFLFKRGVSLSIPDSAKPGLFARMRKLPEATRLAPMLAGTLALAFAANTYELLCTAGFPMVFTRVLTLRDLSTSGYYGYLLMYNLIYVIPLAAIVLMFTITLGAHKLQEREGRVLKLLSGVMMALLGGVILLAPDLLQNVLASIGVMLGAVALTALVVLIDRLLLGGHANGGHASGGHHAPISPHKTHHAG